MKRRPRHDRILELLQTSQLDIDRLAKILEVSAATIRRDLVQLAEQGKITRTYGGVLLPPTGLERSLQERAMIARRITAKKTFVSADGVVAGRGLCEATAEQAALKALMLEQAREIYILADSTKLVIATLRFGHLSGKSGHCSPIPTPRNLSFRPFARYPESKFKSGRLDR